MSKEDKKLFFPNFPQISTQELGNLNLKPEVLSHYQQENEIKRLLIEREMYKKIFEQYTIITSVICPTSNWIIENNILKIQSKFFYIKPESLI